MISAMTFSVPAFAQNVSLQELQDLPANPTIQVEPGKTINQNHWAYKSLENISKKYGLLLGNAGEKFDGNKAITRNEAAVILVNLLGKVQQESFELSEAEKIQLDILKNEFNGEMDKLTGRVEAVEKTVDALKGSVAKVEENDKKQWTYGFGEKFQIGGLMQMKYNGAFDNSRASSSNYNNPAYIDPNLSIPVSEFRFSGKLHPHIQYMASMNAHRTWSATPGGILGDAFVMTDIVPKHKIYIGQTREPIGQEGTLSPSALDAVERALIGRQFGDTRDLGIKINGDWGLVEYFIGAYNGSGQNIKDTNGDMAVGGWGIIKPFKYMPQYGDLQLAGGYYTGKRNSNATPANSTHDTYGFYSAYKFKRYGIKGEFAERDGYDRLLGTAAGSSKARGWYVTNTFDLTKKLQLVARYDTFDRNTSASDDKITEYTVGTNYFLRGNNIKFQVNAAYVNDEAGDCSQRLGVLTQYAF